MRPTGSIFSNLALLMTLGVYLLPAHHSFASIALGAQAPQQPMSFFVTSVGKGDGANLGGLAGADAQCQTLAAAVGRGGMTWHAYLSTQGPDAVNARDRIGRGPWHNADGLRVAESVDDLHSDNNRLGKANSLTERGAVVNGFGDTPNQHDVLTGSLEDGTAFTDSTDRTCSNYTSNASSGAGQVGHTDTPRGQGGNNHSWNSAHPSRGCSQDNLVAIGGAGLFYCFAAN